MTPAIRNGDATPALQWLSAYSTLEQVARLCQRLTPLDPRFAELAALATDAQVGRLALLDRIGLDPTLTEVEQTVELDGQVHTLPDLFDDVVRELQTRVRCAAPKEDTMSETITREGQRPATAAELNGPQALEEAGFVGRFVTPVMRRLRLPTLKEAGIAVALLVLGLAIYEAATSGPEEVAG